MPPRSPPGLTRPRHAPDTVTDTTNDTTNDTANDTAPTRATAQSGLVIHRYAAGCPALNAVSSSSLTGTKPTLV